MRTRTLLIAICAALIFAESESLAADASSQTRRSPRAGGSANAVQSARVELTEQGYQPSSVRLRRGVPARVTFVRKVSGTCATEVVIPEYGVRRALPLDEPVVVELTPERSGGMRRMKAVLALTCALLIGFCSLGVQAMNERHAHRTTSGVAGGIAARSKPLPPRAGVSDSTPCGT